MHIFSALVTATAEMNVTVRAADDAAAREAMERGEFASVRLHDGGLEMVERFHDVAVIDESFGRDDAAPEPTSTPADEKVESILLSAFEVGVEEAPPLDGREVSAVSAQGTVNLSQWHGTAPAVTITIDGHTYAVAILFGIDEGDLAHD